MLSTLPGRARLLAMSIVTALLAAVLTVGVVAPAAQADGVISLTATTPESILAGETETVALEARNSSSTDRYNLSFRYEMLPGISYVAGSTVPAGLGDPTIVTVTDGTEPLVTHQVLLWSNVSDLAGNDVSGIRFTIRADPELFPVGSVYRAEAGAFAHSDARMVPKFDATGVPIASSYTDDDQLTSEATSVSALDLTKSEPSPEHELLRGVHDQATVYSIRVVNTEEGATTGVTVVDYLPSWLEFLGCGRVDNSTTGVEYDGAPALTSTTAPGLTPGECTTPTSVETVENPSGRPAGIYTKVTWTLGTLAAGASRTIDYAAAVPLRANTMAFAAGTPAPTSGGQAANLDNNTGASTRHVDDASAITNTATASGTYTGLVAPGATTTTVSSDSVTVTASDLSIIKSVDRTDFEAGEIATYELLLRASEYASTSAMTIVDTLDNGLCPAFPVGTTRLGDTFPAECDPARDPRLDEAPSGATIESVRFTAATGEFEITMTPDTATLATNATATISYPVLMRSTFSGSLGGPTAAGDTFDNAVEIDGTSTARPATEQSPTTQPVRDDSHAALATDETRISKSVLERTPVSTAAECAAAPTTGYTTTPTSAFLLGDALCFRLEIDFADTTESRNARVTDMVPVGTTFAGWAYGAESTVPAPQVVLASSGETQATWNLGRAEGTSGRYVAKGQVAVLYVLATIDAQGSNAAKPDLVDNLMKYRQENSVGSVASLRTNVGYAVASAPSVALDKAIVSRNGSAVAPTSSTTAGGGTALGYRLSVSNTGTAAAGTDVPVGSVTVWDALPVGVACEDVSGITAGGTCGPAPAGIAASHADRDVILWTIASLAPSAVSELAYTVTVPAGISVSSRLVNDASVTRFSTVTTSGATTTYRTRDSLDASAPAEGDGSAPAANDTATVTLPDATVAKTGGGVASAATNVSGASAVNGQGVEYTYSVTIPAGTTVFNGSLTDPLPATLDPSNAAYTVTGPDGAVHEPGAFAATAGASADFSLSTDGTVEFPAVFRNDGATPLVFTVRVTGLTVTPGAALGTLRNTVRFDSTTTEAGTTAVPTRTANRDLTVVAPSPRITKTASKTAGLTAGETVTFTLTASNTSSATGADVVIADCLPTGLTFASYQSPLPDGVMTFGPDDAPAGIGCSTGTRAYGYLVPTLANGASRTLTISATIDTAAAGSASYTNTARVVTSSLADGQRDTAVESVQSASSGDVVVTVAPPTIGKTVTVGDATGATGNVPAGGSASYTLTATVPASVNLYDAVIVDALPTGVTVSGAPTCSVGTTGLACSQFTTGTASPVGFALGTISAAPTARTLTVSIPVTVTAAAAAGTRYDNRAYLAWNSTAKGTTPSTTTTSPTYTNRVASPVASLTATVPSVSMSKAVSNGAPKPGDTFTYTVTATNAATATSSTAHDVTIVDNVPVGVVVSDVPGGGVVSADGRTVTWTVTAIPTGGSASFTYRGVLAASADLDGTAQVNTVRATEYFSLPGASGGRYASAPASAAVTPVFPEVTATKSTVTTSPATIGSAFTWGVSLQNTGSDAARVRADDVLPANWTFVSGSATITRGSTTTAVADPTVSTADGVQTLVWTDLGGLAGGETAVLRYAAVPTEAVVDAPGVGASVPHTNRVSVTAYDATGASSSQAGPYAGPDASASTSIHSADLSIEKVASAAPLTAGTSGTGWTLSVSNDGPDAAVGPITVTDIPELPAGVTVTGAAGAGWSCSVPETDGSFTCVPADRTATLAPGASFPDITVTVGVASSVAAGTSIPNTATVSSATHDGDPTGDTSTAELETAATADLSIEKITSGAVGAGRTVSWLLRAANAGPSDALGTVTVTDDVPAGVSGVTADGGDAWSCDVDGNTVTCERDGLARGSSVEPIVVTGRVDSGLTGTLANTATVENDTNDPVSDDNTSSTEDAIDTDTTLAVEKTLPGGELVPGTRATYRIAVTATGDADARDVSVADALPTGLSFVSAASVAGDWSCAAADGTNVVCELDGVIPASETRTLDVTVAVSPSLTGDVVNRAVASAENAPDATGSWTNASTPLADLTVSKSHPAGDVVAGTDLDYTIVVGNAGPSDIPSGSPTTVTDVLPAGQEFVSASGDGWTSSYESDTRTVTLTTSAAVPVSGSFPAVTLTVALDASLTEQSMRNTVTAVNALASGSVTASDDVLVTTEADVSIEKSLTSSPVAAAGTEATFDIVVSNAGPSNAAALEIADLLPPGMTATEISGDGWTCDVEAVQCTLATLAPGATTVSVTVAIDPAVRASRLENTATLTWTDSDGGHSDQSSATVEVVERADISLEKTAVDEDGKEVSTAIAGLEQRYSIVVSNAGPSDASGPVTVVDTLPEGVSFVGSNDGWTCAVDAVDARTVTCSTRGAIAADGTGPELILTTAIDGSLPAGELTNSVTASTGSPSGIPVEPADATVTVEPLANVSIDIAHAGDGAIDARVPFTVSVANDGPSAARDVTVVVHVPAGLRIDGTLGSDQRWTCAEPVSTDTGADVTCVLDGVLASGTSAPPLVLGTIVTGGAYPSVSVTAEVSTSTPEPTLEDNADVDALPVAALSSLSITKTHEGPLTRGETVDYTITVTNSGPTEDPGPVVVTDALPRGLASLAVSSDGATCELGQIVRCVVDGPLGAGESVVVELTARVAADAPERVVNTAVVETESAQVSDSGPVEGARTAEDPAEVTGEAALPFTGASVWSLLVMAIAALAAGGVLLLARRRAPSV
ncbi:DUF11 domain-containing protein [Labedella phragmitis]|uniref:DUF11 domain-containing protein n=1 Tax=Labedella phragmitis TaxID=2498849 RepID=A0A444PQF3_9MICO|nr:DUF11 domain-containing protein [Labedella phragmitis]RWZ46596.1 DUF11 domain-containing protein [Labedella phragmitis]